MTVHRLLLDLAGDPAECWSHYGVDPWVDDEDIDVIDDLEMPAYLAAA